LNIPKKYFLGCNDTSTTPTENDKSTEILVRPTRDAVEASKPLPDEEVGETKPMPTLLVKPIQECLRIEFGTDVKTQNKVFWEPTNTSKVLNPNTAIIGTMGTGKTQFTKSLVTQLIRNQRANVDGHPIGVLILDYKADYVKPDFVRHQCKGFEFASAAV
jgi:DNA phosphorothioation-dependent restriction protein DptH